MKLIVSLHPFTALGGGEIYTVNVWKAMARHDPRWRLLVPLCKFAGTLRPDTPFLEYSCDHRGSVFTSSISAGSLVMDAVPRASHVWIHQFAADAFAYDLCLAAGSHAELLLTNLGCEPLLGEFGEMCGHWPRLLALEISEYAAARTRTFRLPAADLTAGVWRREICAVPPQKQPDSLIAVGRVMPHKGFDVTIEALPAEQTLTIVGNTHHHPVYRSHLEQCAHGRNVVFAGGMRDEEKNRLVGASRFLVASSTHRGFDGTVYPQVELLGLVILEAVALGTLPIVSDIPPFLEIMRRLRLDAFVYPEGDRQALRSLLMRHSLMGDDAYRQTWSQARERLIAHYLWDDFALRFQAAVNCLPSPAACAS